MNRIYRSDWNNRIWQFRAISTPNFSGQRWLENQFNVRSIHAKVMESNNLHYFNAQEDPDSPELPSPDYEGLVISGPSSFVRAPLSSKPSPPLLIRCHWRWKGKNYQGACVACLALWFSLTIINIINTNRFTGNRTNKEWGLPIDDPKWARNRACKRFDLVVFLSSL